MGNVVQSTRLESWTPFPLHKVPDVTSGFGHLHKMERCRKLTHPLEFYPPAHCSRESLGTHSAPTLKLARVAVSLEVRRGGAPPPLMTRHASPNPRVTSQRTGLMSQARKQLHAMHGSALTHGSLYVQYFCLSEPSQESSEYVGDLRSLGVGSTNLHGGLTLAVHINTTSVEFILPSRVHAQGAAVLREEVI